MLYAMTCKHRRQEIKRSWQCQKRSIVMPASDRQVTAESRKTFVYPA